MMAQQIILRNWYASGKKKPPFPLFINGKKINIKRLLLTTASGKPRASSLLYLIAMTLYCLMHYLKCCKCGGLFLKPNDSNLLGSQVYAKPQMATMWATYSPTIVLMPTRYICLSNTKCAGKSLAV